MQRKKFCKMKLMMALLLCAMILGVCYGGSVDVNAGQTDGVETHSGGTVGGVKWDLTDGVLTITGTGDFINEDGDRGFINAVGEFVNCPWEDQRSSIRRAVVNWTEMTTLSGLFFGCENLADVDLSGLNTNSVKFMRKMFSGCSSLASLDLSGFNTDQVISMDSMFSGCSSLTSLDLSGFKTDKVTDMCCMFLGCSSLRSLDVSGFNTEKVTDMRSMFSGCSSLTSLNVSGFKTNKVTDMGCMFLGCSSLRSLDVSGFNTEKVTDMGGMFLDCSSLRSLDVSSFNTEKVTDMSSMFWNCSSLTYIDINNFRTYLVKSMACMFVGCSRLTYLDISRLTINTIEVTDMEDMFLGCDSLQRLVLPPIGNQKILLPGGTWKDENGKIVFYVQDLTRVMAYTKVLDMEGHELIGTVILFVDSKYTITSANTVAYTGTTNAKAKSVTIPDVITNEQGTFNVTTIAASALEGNKKIKSVTIGSNITKIEKKAFSKCKNLKKIIVKTKKLESVGKNALKGIHKKCKIKVPAQKVKDYQKKFKKKGQKSSVKISK